MLLLFSFYLLLDRIGKMRCQSVLGYLFLVDESYRNIKYNYAVFTTD